MIITSPNRAYAKPKFDVGDVVGLKSGGPAMTVGIVTTYDEEDKQGWEPDYSCWWFDTSNQIQQCDDLGESMLEQREVERG